MLSYSPDSCEIHMINMTTLFCFFRVTTFVQYCQRILLRLGVDYKIVDLTKLVLYWAVAIHWAACLQFLPGLLLTKFDTEVKIGVWYENSVFRRHNVFGKYVICLYKSVMSFIANGYIKDLKPVKLCDKVYSAWLTVIGRFCLSFTLAYLFEVIQGIESSYLRYDEMMVQLNKFTDKNNLPANTKAKLKKNYDFMFRKRYFNEHKILMTVSASLRQQILIHNTRQLVDNSAFFENLPSFLILKIITTLSLELYLEGDVIYTMGEVGMCVYFITSGSVAFYSPSGKEVCHFSDGDYFGEMTIVSDVKHRYARAVALETTECYK